MTLQSLPELKVFLETSFTGSLEDQNLLIDMRYFSQYIPKLGFRFAVEMVYNSEPNTFYVALCSLNPPADYYQRHSNSLKVVSFTEMNWLSKLRAQQFGESLFSFKNVPSNHKTTMIIDIKTVTIKNKGIAQIEDYGWTVFPIYSTMTTEENKDTLEVYVNSGTFMMPLVRAPVVTDFINTIASHNDPFEYMHSQITGPMPPQRYKEPVSVIVRCVDNQREQFYERGFDWEEIDHKYVIPKKLNKYAYDRNAHNRLRKTNTVESLLPRSKTKESAQEEITNIVRAVNVFSLTVQKLGLA